MALQIILSTATIALLAFSGALLLFFHKNILRRILLSLVALAAGGLIGAAFLHLLPEAIEEMGEGSLTFFLFPIAGFFLFLIIEQLLHWHHSHEYGQTDHPKHLGILSLLGDSAHNFLDGVIIAISFLVDPGLGIASVAAIALHEIPQEIAEFGVLVYSGFSRIRALFLNFLSASTVILGGIVGLLIGETIMEPFLAYFFMFVVGTFIYIGASDFVPEIRKERRMLQSIALSLIFASGIFLMWAFTLLE